MPILSPDLMVGSALDQSGIRGLALNLAVKQQTSKAELYIYRGTRDENKSIF